MMFPFFATFLFITALLQLSPSSSLLAPSHHRYYILRHGETDANASGKIQGSSDFSRLTERGRDQAAVAGIKAFGMGNDSTTAFTSTETIPPMDHVYVSPLTRAQETLSILRQNACPTKLPLEHTVLNELREIDLYGWEGRDKYDLQLNDAQSWEAWKVGDPDKFVVDGKQPLVELWSRAEQVWDIIRRQQHQQVESLKEEGEELFGRNTLLVCHGSLGQALLCTACGLDETNFRKNEFPNCGLVEISWVPMEKRARSFKWHLPESSH